MKWRYVIAVIGVAATATVLQAHDFFFRTDTYFTQPNATIKLRGLASGARPR